MYTMKEVCKETGMTYEGLKFYCNQGLVPNVRRDRNNRRVFDEHAMRWVKSLSCLKNCEMSIAEMQQYLAYCLEGPSSIPVRKVMLAKKQDELREKIKLLQEAVDYIDWKQQLYDDILSGRQEYHSDLVSAEE